MSDKTTTPELPQQRHIATLTLIGLCCAIYFSTTLNSSIGSARALELFAAQPQAIWAGEIWRLFTASFVHLNAVHLFLNCFVLLSIGRLIEPILGTARMLLVYILCGIAGMAASMVVNSIPTAGASASIFGLAGMLIGARLVLPLRMVERQQLKAFSFLIILNLLLGMAANQWLGNEKAIDNTAHLFGLIFGLIFGAAFAMDGEKLNHPKLEGWSNLWLGVGGLLFSLVCIVAIKPTFIPAYHLYMAHHYFESKDYLAAEADIAWLNKRPESRGFGQILTGRISLMKNHIEEADQQFKAGLAKLDTNLSIALNKTLQSTGFEQMNEALFFDEKGNARLCQIALEADSPQQDTLNNCAWLLLTARDLSLRKPKLALIWAKQAVNSFPEATREIFDTLAEGYNQTGDSQEALIATQRAAAARVHL